MPFIRRFPVSIERVRAAAAPRAIAPTSPRSALSPVRTRLPPRGPFQPAQLYRDLDLNPAFDMQGSASAPGELRTDAGIMLQTNAVDELLKRHQDLMTERTANVSLSGNNAVVQSAKLNLLAGTSPSVIADGYMLSLQAWVNSSIANFGGLEIWVERPLNSADPELIYAASTADDVTSFAGSAVASYIVPVFKPDFPYFMSKDAFFQVFCLFAPGSGSIRIRYSAVLAPQGVRIAH